MKLSKQQKNILLALVYLEKKDPKYPTTIHEVIAKIEPSGIKHHFSQGWSRESGYIKNIKYASYHRSISNLCEKGVILKSYTGVTSSGRIEYYLTEKGHNELKSIVSDTLNEYNTLRFSLKLLSNMDWGYEPLFDNIYLLTGLKSIKCDFRGHEGCPDHSIIFNSFRNAIKYIEEFESKKENYHCWNCGYELEEKEKYKNIEFTDDHFKNKQCPFCKKSIEYSPEWFKFSIEEYKLNNGFNKTLYECEYDDKDKKTKERFGGSGEFTSRKVNTKIS